jgi:small subunit ribosomal protein S35
MAKPFVPPTQKQILRFRYTSYMGEEHPAEKKVVVEFAVEDMPLSAPQKLKLKKLLGVRYNPGTGLAKMSSEMFPDQLQNKRYLGDLVDSLLKEARDPADMFTDVPLDERHYKAKRKVKFPREWRMTPERMAQLEKTRAEAIALDEQKAAAGLLVDGKSIIESAQLLAKERAAKVLLESPAAAAGSAVKGKGAKKVSIRR